MKKKRRGIRSMRHDDHHIIPRSRGGATCPENIRRVLTTRHRSYHHLVGNATPGEAVLIIARDWGTFTREQLEELHELLSTWQHFLEGAPSGVPFHY